MTRVTPEEITRTMPNSINNKVDKKCKTLFYPGAFNDFTTLGYFLENSIVKDFYYCDYLNYELNEVKIIDNLNNQLPSSDYKVSLISLLTPEHYNQKDWESFWHRNAEARSVGEIDKSFIFQFEIKKDIQKWNLFYFGTEAIKTYEILIKNKIKMDIIVTQDHGCGCLWTTFCRGSRLERLSLRYNSLPDFLLVGENGEGWDGYERITEPFGNFGMHNHPRSLFKKIK
jgi:hypothetical protein